MKLAKQHIDVGLFTNRADETLIFWQQRVGLAFEETLPLGGGVRQHRHAMNGSVLKVNAARDAINDAPPSGYRELIIAREGLAEPEVLIDPDGNRIVLVPPGTRGVTGIGVTMAVRDAVAFDHFFSQAMQFEPAGARAYRCGDSMIMFEEDTSAIHSEPLRAPGFRYLTVQVWDVDAEHAGILQRGGAGAEGRPPVTLGTTARVSFVRDPDGNWIEVSQRASLTGAISA
jgi:catechol 2,3-dioxygenase-like lactoylglutathione lyase family enzyme